MHLVGSYHANVLVWFHSGQFYSYVDKWMIHWVSVITVLKLFVDTVLHSLHCRPIFLTKEDAAVPLACSLTRNLFTGRCSVDLEGILKLKIRHINVLRPFIGFLTYVCFRNEKETLLHGTVHIWITTALYVTVKSLCVTLYCIFLGGGKQQKFTSAAPSLWAGLCD